MQATVILSELQRSVLSSFYHSIEAMAQYLRAVVPCVSGTDEQLLTGLVALAEMNLSRLPTAFPELQPLADVRKKRGAL